MSTAEFLMILALCAVLFGYGRAWRGVKKFGHGVEVTISGLYKGLRAFQREVSKNL